MTLKLFLFGKKCILDGKTHAKLRGWDFMLNTRASGILLHPTSLPGPFGIGDTGQAAYDFIDFLHASGQSYWQILPLEPIGAGNSPYASCSAFAKNIFLISPQQLVSDGLLTPRDIQDIPDFNDNKVQYNDVITYKSKLFKKAFANFNDLDLATLGKFDTFCMDHSYWLDDYSLYISIKEYYQALRKNSKSDYKEVVKSLEGTYETALIDEFYKDGSWFTWPTPLKDRNANALDEIKINLKDEILYHKFLQFLFFSQWYDLKTYANEKNVKIIGDIPIFVSHDSADVWSNPKLFDLNQKGFPVEVAGVPPDYFSANGQLWGNPLYNWDYHSQTDFKWWRMRLRYMLEYVDLARIDHFRGLESFWAVPIESETAKSGKWRKAPGYDLFEAFIKDLGELPIIAEDLGSLTEEVHTFRNAFNLAGMAILQFAFQNDNKNPYLPHNCSQNTVLYTGTHDNDTVLGWYETCDPSVKNHVMSYMNSGDDDIVWRLIRMAYASVCNTVVIPMQDVQQLGTEARMNVPGVATGNWEWRYTQDMLQPSMVDGLNYLKNLYGR